MGAEGEKTRVFTGISLSPPICDYVADVVVQLSREIEGVRWVPVDNLHVTLKFLGWFRQSMIPEILKTMEKAAAQLPLTLEIGEVGAFPSLRSARVIWVGAVDLEGKAEKVYNILERGAEKCGVAREKRSYRPHVTVGRARKNTVRVPEEIAGRFHERFILEVNNLVLFKSDLKPTGAEYSVLEKVGPPDRPDAR